MRTTITSIIIVLCIIFSTATLFTINNYYSRKNEVENSLTSSIEKAAKKIKLEKDNGELNQKSIENEFIQNLLIQIDSDSDIKVNILKCDIDKGLFDVDVVETYKWFGIDRKVNVRRTVILENSNDNTNNEITVIYKISTSKSVSIVFKNSTIQKITENIDGTITEVTSSTLLQNVKVNDNPTSLYFYPTDSGFKNWKEDGEWEKKNDGIILEDDEKMQIENLEQDIMFVAEF